MSTPLNAYQLAEILEEEHNREYGKNRPSTESFLDKAENIVRKMEADQAANDESNNTERDENESN